MIAVITAEQIREWPEGAQVAFIVVQVITGIGFLYFFWLVWACERDLRKLRKDLERRGK